MIHQAEYIASYERVEDCPDFDLPEFTFVGRSNVGKSSLINALTGRKGLAHISKTPGKTNKINYFRINDQWHLVDLPGYGYAQVSKALRRKWDAMIKRYLQHRKQLYCTFVLLDVKIKPQANDIEFINWMGAHGIPFVIVFTKSDKVKDRLVKYHVQAYEDRLLKEWNELPHMFLTSSAKRQGIDALLEYIEDLIES